jgi:hypothetical protein
MNTITTVIIGIAAQTASQRREFLLPDSCMMKFWGILQFSKRGEDRRKENDRDMMSDQ